jgi:hypothetical protein
MNLKKPSTSLTRKRRQLVLERCEDRIVFSVFPIQPTSLHTRGAFAGDVRQELTGEEIAASEFISQQQKQAYQVRYGTLANKLDPELAKVWEAYNTAIAADPHYVAAPLPIEISVDFENTAAVSAALADLGYQPKFILNSAGTANETEILIDLSSFDEILAMDEIGAFRDSNRGVYLRSFLSINPTDSSGEFTKPCAPALTVFRAPKPNPQTNDAVFAAPAAFSSAVSDTVVDSLIAAPKPVERSASISSEQPIAVPPPFYNFATPELSAALLSTATTKKTKSH